MAVNLSFLKTSPWETLWNRTIEKQAYKPPINANSGQYPIVAPTPYVGQPAVQHPAGFPQLPLSELQKQSGQIVSSGNENSYYPTTATSKNVGSVKGATNTQPIITNSVSMPTRTDPNLLSLDPNLYTSGGGGGVNAAAVNAQLEATKLAQQQLAEQERGNIEARRNALIGDTEAAYGDQVKYLDTQESSIRTNADLGRQKVQGQRQMTVEQAQMDAEAAARLARDTYRDLIVQGRRRARATGAGSSSGYLELGNMLDQQLMRGLGDVSQTREKKVGSANMIADQAVGEIENTLNQILGELANNRALSLREKDRAINEARMNAADAMLDVDKWLTKTFSDIESAKLELTTRSTGSGASFNKQAYQQAQRQNQSSLLNAFQQELAQSQAGGEYTPDYGNQLFASYANQLYGQGMGLNDINSLRGLYLPGQNSANNEWEFALNNPTEYENILKMKKSIEDSYE